MYTEYPVIINNDLSTVDFIHCSQADPYANVDNFYFFLTFRDV